MDSSKQAFRKRRKRGAVCSLIGRKKKNQRKLSMCIDMADDIPPKNPQLPPTSPNELTQQIDQQIDGSQGVEDQQQQGVVIQQSLNSSTITPTRTQNGNQQNMDNQSVVTPPPALESLFNNVTNLINYNPRAFANDSTSTDGARSKKHRHMNKFGGKFMQLLEKEAGNNPEQQFLIFYDFLKKNANHPLLATFLQAVKQQNTEDSVARKVICNIKELLDYSKVQPKSNEAMSFNATIMLAISPTRGQLLSEEVDSLAKMLGKNRRLLVSLLKKSGDKRKAILVDGSATKLVQVHRRKSRSIFSPQYINDLHQWLYNKQGDIHPSANAKDSVMVKNPITGDKERMQKYYYHQSIRLIHNDLIKDVEHGGFAGARDANNRVVISDTMLRKLMPRNISRLTDSQKEMCGCEVCIIAKGLIITFSAWETRTYQHLVGLGNNRAAAFETEMHKYKHPRDAVLAISCPPIDVGGPWPLHKLNCCMGICNECPQMEWPEVENETDDNARIITFQIMFPHSYCSVHKSLPDHPSTCPHCKEIEEDEDNHEKTGKLFRKKYLTRFKKKIGYFMPNTLKPMIERYRYHISLVALLGKHHTIHQRDLAYKHNSANVLIIRDYADALSIAFDKEVQSDHFGNQAKISMEGITVKYMKQTGEDIGQDEFVEVMDYRCYLADDKRQDARTSYINTKHMIDRLRESTNLLVEGSTLYQQCDGCAKQYRCALSLYLQSAIACAYKINYDVMNTAPGHGKGPCDSQGGVDKSECICHMRTVGLPETEGDSKYVHANKIDENGKRKSMAEEFAKILNDPARTGGVKGHKKHQKRETNKKINMRYYAVMHHGNTDVAANSHVPLMNTNCKATGFTKQNDPYYGISSHYHFYACPQLGLGTIAVRRIPCACEPCSNQLRNPWETGIMPCDQPRFKCPENCAYKRIFGEKNKWKIIKIVAGADDDEAARTELEEVYDDILIHHENRVADEIIIGGYGAIDADDDREEFYLVKWTTDAYPLANDSNTVEGVNGTLPAGSMVAKGIYWNKVARATDWYTPPPPLREEERTFRIRYVLKGNISLLGHNNGAIFPSNRRDRQSVLAKNPMKICENSRIELEQLIAERALLDYLETMDPTAMSAGNGDDSEEEDDSQEPGSFEEEDSADEW